MFENSASIIDLRRHFFLFEIDKTTPKPHAFCARLDLTVCINVLIFEIIGSASEIFVIFAFLNTLLNIRYHVA